MEFLEIELQKNRETNELAIIVDGFEFSKFKLDKEQNMNDICNVIRNIADVKTFKIIQSEVKLCK